MASRPVFAVLPNDSDELFTPEFIDFQFFNGFSDVQKRKSIRSLHDAYLQQHPEKRVLEISSKSETEIGVWLSAFNLMIRRPWGAVYSVESAFQASKVFEHGGPYTDLLHVSSRVAKRDERLRNSGNVIKFQYDGFSFDTEPKTYFYNWLYINTLHEHQDLAQHLVHYDAFTDIEFNPSRSINCQAESAAIYVALSRRGLLEQALHDRQSFLNIVYPSPDDEEPEQPQVVQPSLF